MSSFFETFFFLLPSLFLSSLSLSLSSQLEWTDFKVSLNPLVCPVVRIELTHVHSIFPNFNMGFATIPLSQIWAGQSLKV